MRLTTGSVLLSLFLANPAQGQIDGAIELFNVQVNSDGSPGEVDFASRNAPVTLLFDGQIGKIIVGVYARLSGSTWEEGISGAEFYIEGLETHQLPPGWTKTVVPAEGTYVLGEWSDPHSHRGQLVRRVNMAWPVSGPSSPECQKEPSVLLGRIELQSPIGDPSFPRGSQAQVVRGDPPSGLLACPLLLLCDSPLFTGVCVTGGALCIGIPGVPAPGNPSPADQATKVPPTTSLTWEAMDPVCCYGIGTAWTEVYLGTSTDPPLVFRDESRQRSTYDPAGDLSLSTTYYWRIRWTQDNDCGHAESPVWSFTTASSVSLASTKWQTVKQFYR